jgi:hypothetical protein
VIRYEDTGHTPIADLAAFIAEETAGGDKARIRLKFTCPKRPDRECEVMVSTPGREHQHPYWKWDGNAAAPTLSPSINCNGPGGCGWHGHLTAGEFKGC